MHLRTLCFRIIQDKKCLIFLFKPGNNNNLSNKTSELNHRINKLVQFQEVCCILCSQSKFRSLSLSEVWSQNVAKNKKKSCLAHTATNWAKSSSSSKACNIKTNQQKLKLTEYPQFSSVDIPPLFWYFPVQRRRERERESSGTSLLPNIVIS